MSLFRSEKHASRRFEPIRILPFTWRQKRRLIKKAALPAQAYNFPFNLSARPPAKWLEFFQTAWYQQQGGGEMPLVRRRTISVVCAVGDLQVTLSTLKLVVASANEKYGGLVRRQAEAEEAEKSKKQDAKSRAEREVGEALDKLKF